MAYMEAGVNPHYNLNDLINEDLPKRICLNSGNM